jgi:hypothetical protein
MGALIRRENRASPAPNRAKALANLDFPLKKMKFSETFGNIRKALRKRSETF